MGRTYKEKPIGALQSIMVVRAVISAVVNRIPYSDHLPGVVKSVLEEDHALNTPPNEVEFIPVSPKAKIHNLMLNRMATLESSALSDASTLLFDNVPEEDEYMPPRDTVVQKYLDEQNAKFDTLINKNMGAVLRQQNYEGDASWPQMVFDLVTAKDTEDVTLKVGVLVGKASTYLYSKVPLAGENKAELVSPIVPVADPIDCILNTLDYNTKVALLKELKADLGLVQTDSLSQLSNQLAENLGSSSSSLVIDKMEMLVIVSVRLAFVGVKFLIPLVTLLYLKFKNNEVMLLNNKNFSRLLSFVIRFMESLEDRLNSEKLHAFQYGEEKGTDGRDVKDAKKPREKELKSAGVEGRGLSGARKFKDETLNEEFLRYIDEWSGDEAGLSASWTRTFTKLAVGRYFSSPTQDYVSDPKYAQYFSERRLEYERDSCASDDQRPSVFSVAQQFAEEMT